VTGSANIQSLSQIRNDPGSASFLGEGGELLTKGELNNQLLVSPPQ
jgi:hypothetical protein